jgi:hypothetical protein
MEKELLLALASMYAQYCAGAWGHKNMQAGEGAYDVLLKYGLIDNDNGLQGGTLKDDYEELIEIYFKSVYPQP